MITVHRDYRVSIKPERYAHVEINPVGKLDVEIKGQRQHYVVDFEQLAFSSDEQGVALVCQKAYSPWKVMLATADAQELKSLVKEAQEEYEILMRDL
ncbi:hypothetical protein QNE21_002073 [Vibrio vulnificus]|nr:hypothetical protein [Vibrio vulnificus]